MRHPDTPKYDIDPLIAYASLAAHAHEIADNRDLPEDVRVFAAAVLPVLESLDYQPPDAPPQGATELTSHAVRQGLADETPAPTTPPIWAN